MINTVIFDLDGTLINSLEDIQTGVNYALNYYGYKERSLEEIRCFIGNGADMLIKQALPGNTKKADFENVLRLYKEYYDEHSVVKTKPYEGIMELMADLKRLNINVAVNTNKPDFVANLITAYFFKDILTIGADVEKRRKKPYSDGVDYIIKMLDVNRENCIYVGDTAVDIETAKNSRVKSVGALWGFRDYIELKEADYIVSKPKEILEIIKNSYGV